MSPGGGEAARSGFNYQDLAAATFFVTNREATKLKIEPDNADFLYEEVKDGTAVEHYFEVKKRGSDHFTWGDYKSAISENFSRIASEEHDEDVQIELGVITNASFNQGLDRFLRDLDKVKTGEMTQHSFKTKHQRTKIDALRKSTGLEGSPFEQLINSLTGYRRTRRALKLELKDYLRDCHPMRHSQARDSIKDYLGRFSETTVSRQKLEEVAQIPLEPRNASSQATNNQGTGKVLDDLEGIVEKQEQQLDEIDRQEHFEYIQTADEYIDTLPEGSRQETNAEKRSSNFEDGAKKIAEGKELLYQGREEVQYWGNAMIDLVEDSRDEDD